MPWEEEDFGMNGWPRMPPNSVDLNLTLKINHPCFELLLEKSKIPGPKKAHIKQYSKDRFCLAQCLANSTALEVVHGEGDQFQSKNPTGKCIFLPKSCLFRYWFPSFRVSRTQVQCTHPSLWKWTDGRLVFHGKLLLPKRIKLGPKMVLSLCLASRDFHQNRKEQQGRGICFDLGCQSKKGKPKETFPCARGAEGWQR